jgi:hypothetical protein
MKWALVITLLFMGTRIVMSETKVTFDEARTLPKGWESGITGKGSVKWEVVTDGTAPSRANVLKQSGEATFCWAAKTDEHIQDGFAEMKFKPISGKEDQAGGIVFRFQDANNYYVVRGNALEDNVVLYKTVNGKRSSLQVKGRMIGYGVDVDVSKARWNTLRVEFKASLFTVFFNGKKLFEVEDDTFKEAGGVGVWTKADSVTLFDNFVFGTK